MVALTIVCIGCSFASLVLAGMYICQAKNLTYYKRLCEKQFDSINQYQRMQEITESILKDIVYWMNTVNSAVEETLDYVRKG